MLETEMQMNKLLSELERYILYAVILLVPLTVLPIFSDFYGLPKLLALGIGATLVLLLRGIRILSQKKLEIASGSFDIPLLLVAAAYVISTIFTNSNKMEAFFAPGTVSIVVGSFLLYFLLNNLNLGQKAVVKYLLFTSALIISVVSALSQTGVITKVPALNQVFGNSLSLTGGSLIEIIFLVSVLPIAVELIAFTTDAAKKVFYAVSGIIIVLGLVMSIIAILPGSQNPLILPTLKTSLSVTLDALKENPVFGVGPGNYLSAFSKFRPIAYNATNIWQLRFTTANNFYFTMLTETGLLGLAGLIFLLVAVVKLVKKTRFDSFQSLKEGHVISLILLIVLLAIFPANVVTICLLFIFLALAGTTRKHEVELPSSSGIFPYLVVLPLFVGIATLYFFAFQAVSAEMIFKKALASFNKGDGKTTYDQMRQAINLNPYVDRYHAAYAQTNLAIAQSLAQSKDLTDADKQTISTLIQQAIREAKNNVILNQTRSSNWELLARVYQAIMPYTQGADQFAIQSYSQAIALDPINPNLRIALGGVYYGLGKFDQAIDVFKLAVAAKSDLPNSHYNLSAAYREKKEYDNAIAEMEIVLTLVAKDSPDYKIAQDELEALKKKAPTKSETTQTSELTPPQKTESVITPPLELPQEATPPATTANP